MKYLEKSLRALIGPKLQEIRDLYDTFHRIEVTGVWQCVGIPCSHCPVTLYKKDHPDVDIHCGKLAPYEKYEIAMATEKSC